MKSMPSYPAAARRCRRAQAHFARHLSSARERGLRELASPPDRDAIEIIDAAFWASLRREEGYVAPNFAGVPAARAGGQPLTFERPLPLDAGALTRLAPAVERPGHPSRRVARRQARCRSGARRARFRRCASCSKWSRRACWSSSIAADRGRRSSSTSRCSRATRSRCSTKRRASSAGLPAAPDVAARLRFAARPSRSTC